MPVINAADKRLAWNGSGYVLLNQDGSEYTDVTAEIWRTEPGASAAVMRRLAEAIEYQQKLMNHEVRRTAVEEMDVRGFVRRLCDLEAAQDYLRREAAE